MSDIGPGDVVVVVDMSCGPRQVDYGNPSPPVGSRQIVSWVGPCPIGHIDAGNPSLGISGYPNPGRLCDDYGWALRRFRKAGAGDHHESILNALKTPKRQPVDA